MADIKAKMFKESICSYVNSEHASAILEKASFLKLPEEADRQLDLQYLNAILVSSGMNKNGAVFLGSELVKARNTIPVKAIDIEHNEQMVIGHITGSTFLTREGEFFDAEEASSKLKKEEGVGELDQSELDVAISGVIYKTRFPEIAEEVNSGAWMVSMECFYQDYDVKVGDLIIPRDYAEKMGYDKMVGKVVHLRDGNKELGFHLVGRILRGIVFSGVGLVKDPANERSIIMESAAYKKFISTSSKENASQIDLENIDIPSLDKDKLKKDIGKKDNKNAVAFTTGLLPGELRPGTCVSFKRYVYDIPTAEDDKLPKPPTDLSQYPLANHPGDIDTIEPSAKIIHENYCELFDLECSARPGDATLPLCWRNVFARVVKEEVTSYWDILHQKRMDLGLVKLESLIENAKRIKRLQNKNNEGAK